MITVRPARLEELDGLIERMEGERIDLYGTPAWVAEEDGKLLGMVACRLVWQIEPLTVFPEVTNEMTRRRAGLALYRSVAGWMSDRDRNATGIYTAFAVTRNAAVVGWTSALGWYRQYRDALLVMKKF